MLQLLLALVIAGNPRTASGAHRRPPARQAECLGRGLRWEPRGGLAGAQVGAGLAHGRGLRWGPRGLAGAQVGAGLAGGRRALK
jgi:hypothetical protein